MTLLHWHSCLAHRQTQLVITSVGCIGHFMSRWSCTGEGVSMLPLHNTNLGVEEGLGFRV